MVYMSLVWYYAYYFVFVIPWFSVVGSGLFDYLLVFDEGNVGLLWLVVLLVPIIDFVAGYEVFSYGYLAIFGIINVLMFLAFGISSLLWFFVMYEVIVMGMFVLIMLFVPSMYRVSASFYLFVFSLIGSLAFYFALVGMLSMDSVVIGLLLLVPFYIKVPSFPFYYWLPEVHAEASSSCSLYLAGLLLKLGVYGIWSFMLSGFFFGLSILVGSIFFLAVLGFWMCTVTCFSVFDLKKMIAYSSVMHLNMGLAALFCFSFLGLVSCLVLAIAHGFSSVGLFMVVGFMMNSVYSRFYDGLLSMDVLSSMVFFALVLAGLSFPGFFGFMSELLALLVMFMVDGYFALLFLVGSFLGSLYWFLLVNRKSFFWSMGSLAFSLSVVEMGLLMMFLECMLFLGCSSLR